MPGKSGETAKVALRPRIGGDHLQYRTTGQSIQLELGLEQRHRTRQTTGIQLDVMHGIISTDAHPVLLAKAGSIPMPAARWPAKPAEGYSRGQSFHE